MSVTPSRLDAVGTDLAKCEELAFVASTTGPANLVANALCQDPADLHRFLAHRLGSVTEIRTVETTPVLQTFKGSSPSPAVNPISRLDRVPRRSGLAS